MPTVLFLLLWSLRSLISAENPPDSTSPFNLFGLNSFVLDFSAISCNKFVSPLDNINPYNSIRLKLNVNSEEEGGSNGGRGDSCEEQLNLNSELLSRPKDPQFPTFDSVGYAPETAESEIFYDVIAGNLVSCM